jgi:two-component system cell cycle sensor histidine kinase/response regulator CckA
MKMIQELAVTAVPVPKALRIMVVDDEDAVRRYTDRVLRAAGYQPVLAANGFEALRLAESMGGVDALVTDLMMPDMNGVELARRLRQGTNELKVLYMSGFCDRIVDVEARRTGNEAFLEKPYSIKALEQAVSMLIYGDLQPPA